MCVSDWESRVCTGWENNEKCWYEYLLFRVEWIDLSVVLLSAFSPTTAGLYPHSIRISQGICKWSSLTILLDCHLYQHCWDLSNNRWYRLCHWFRVCKAKSLQSQIQGRIPACFFYFQGECPTGRWYSSSFHWIASRPSRQNPTRQMLSIIYRAVVSRKADCIGRFSVAHDLGPTISRNYSKWYYFDCSFVEGVGYVSSLSRYTIGIDNLSKFDFIDPPSTNVLIRALEQLSYLGALDYESNLTPIGRLLASIPINPQQAKCLLLAPQFNCMNEMLTITSMLNVPQPFLRPVDKQHEADECKRQFGCYEGDHIVLLNLYTPIRLFLYA